MVCLALELVGSWVSLTVDNLFTINLDVLSLVLYRWRSLEATVRKTESQRQEA